MQPDVAVVERVVLEEQRSKAGLRIIFNGVGGGQLSFQEVLVNGPNVVGSRAVNFDQFAKQVSIGPFDFDVIEAGGGKVTLKYNIAERMTIAPSDVSKLPPPLMR